MPGFVLEKPAVCQQKDIAAPFQPLAAAALAARFHLRPSSVVGINEKDMKYSTEILAAFHGMAELVKDNSIKIGGLKGYCKSMRIVADETLDTKLSAQREWFIENSGLSVLN